MFKSSFMKRLLRATVSILISGAIVKTTNDPKYIMLAPVIQAGAKWIRDRFNLTLPL